MTYDCKHGSEMCDQCLNIMGDGITQGRQEERNEILESLIDADSAYDFHSGCRLCEAIALVKEISQNGDTKPVSENHDAE